MLDCFTRKEFKSVIFKVAFFFLDWLQNKREGDTDTEKEGFHPLVYSPHGH